MHVLRLLFLASIVNWLPFLPVAGSDYVALTSLLSFTGTQSQTIPVTIITDQILEDDENFFGNLALVPTSLNVTVDPTMAMITILDDDRMCCDYETFLRICSCFLTNIVMLGFAPTHRGSHWIYPRYLYCK